ncbi:cyclophilin-like fold protein [Conyzicola sp.]|uniref:cyclophilin-like fold protein n=1 Tax=Conyzicola sp. TaxID=1969404 RepID=UPI003989CE99
MAAISVIVIGAASQLSGCAAVLETESSAPATSTGTPSATPPAPASPTDPAPAADVSQITITIDGTRFTGTLNDSATAQDLASRLPLTVEFGPNNSDEKVARLDTPLSTDGAPDSDDPLPGEIGYYIPWDALVLYNGDAGDAPGTVRLGTFDIDPALIADQDGTFPVTFDVAR